MTVPTTIVINTNTVPDNTEEFDDNEIEKIKNIDTLLINDKYDWLNYTYDLIVDYIDINLLEMCNDKFDMNIYNNIYELLSITLAGIYKLEESNVSCLSCIHYFIEYSLKVAYSKFVPRRSYKLSFIRNANHDVIFIQNKIKYLQNIIQPDQRTDEWYEFRHRIITASNLWKIFDSECVLNNLIYEKCNPYIKHDKTPFINIYTSLHWGQKYEPLSTLIYEMKNKTTIGEFGCIQHRKYDYIGASPDGINMDINNKIYGRMLEIKNIVNREITKIPKKAYWIQMQIQMEVCDLNECDFLETRFIEYDNYQEFCNDGDVYLSSDNKMKGKILMFYDNNIPIYEYYLHDVYGDYDKWEAVQFEKHDKIMFMRTIYWKLDEYSCLLVLRNNKWFKEAVKKITNVWNLINFEKQNGFEHRAPKKRVRKNSISLEDEKKQCFIQISSKTKSTLND
jgi:putative phage-type endonuclease